MKHVWVSIYLSTYLLIGIVEVHGGFSFFFSNHLALMWCVSTASLFLFYFIVLCCNSHLVLHKCVFV